MPANGVPGGTFSVAPQIGWSTLELYGVQLGAAQLAPALADGRLTLPPVAVPAGDGRVNLAGTLDFAPQDPLLSIPQPLNVLERVPLTPAVAGASPWARMGREVVTGFQTLVSAAVYAKDNDEEDFARRILDLLVDPARREQMGVLGFERLKNELSWEHSTPQLLSAYRYLRSI